MYNQWQLQDYSWFFANAGGKGNSCKWKLL